jgi:excisionase family DNA binding protein
MQQDSQLLTVREVAAQIGLSKIAVYRKVEAGELPSIRLGDGPKAPIRINPDDLVEWLSQHYAVGAA